MLLFMNSKVTPSVYLSVTLLQLNHWTDFNEILREITLILEARHKLLLSIADVHVCGSARGVKIE